MQTFKLASFSIEQVADLDGLEWRLGQYFAGLHYPVRQIATSRRFDMSVPLERLQQQQRELQRLARLAGPLVAAIDALLAGERVDPAGVLANYVPEEQALFSEAVHGLPQLRHLLSHRPAQHALAHESQQDWADIADAVNSRLWRLPWQKEMARFYSALQERHLRAIDHHVMTWEQSDVSATAIQAGLRHASGRDVQLVAGMPPIIGCSYSEQAIRLVPDQPGFPYLAVLTSYELRGGWDAMTLHPLLDVNFDVSVLVDIDTVPRHKAMRIAELAHAAARTVHRDATLIDPRAKTVYLDSERVMDELRVQSYHLVSIAVLVSGDTPDALEDNVATITNRLGSTLRLTRIAGAQGPLLRLWSSTPTRRLDVPLKPWNMLSHGVGCCAALIGYHRSSEVRGLLWGLDAVRRAPLFWDPFVDNQAAHMCILGKTGFGKTVFLNQITLRAAAIAGWRVIGIDAFKNGERLETAAGVGARCNWIGLESVINILDVVYDEATEGGWIPNQVQHVIGQLATLLGELGANAQGEEDLIPRRFTLAESSLLDQALTALYRDIDPHAPLDDMPILEDLLPILADLDEDESDALARDLELFLRRSLAQSFNATTTIDWDFSADINYFDFSRVPKTLRGFYYGQAVGAIGRYMRDPRRDLRRPTLLVIDEFHYVTRTEAVAQMAAEIAKVARKYKLAVLPVDQNPTTFLDNVYGLFIWENSAGKVLFHLDDLPARRIADAVSDLTPEHLEFLIHAQPGEAVMIFGNDVYRAHVEINPREARAFLGS
jgi:hypothetical protein